MALQRTGSCLSMSHCPCAGYGVKGAEQRGIITSSGCGPAHTAQDPVGRLFCRLTFCLMKLKDHQILFHRAAAQPHSSWPLSLQPVSPLLSLWVFLEDVCKICFLLSPVMMTFQNVSEQPCYDIGLVSQHPWIHHIWSNRLLRVDLT